MKNRLGATVQLKAGDTPTIVLKPCGQAKATLVDQNGQPIVDYSCSFYIVVTPGACPYDFKSLRKGKLAADADFVSNVDFVNYPRSASQTDKQGHVTFPALIPGATYCIYGMDENENWVTKKDFTVKSGETLDLGRIAIPSKNGKRR